MNWGSFTMKCAGLMLLLALVPAPAAFAKIDWSVPVEVVTETTAVPVNPSGATDRRTPFFNLASGQLGNCDYYPEFSGNQT
ncbi:MAG TPA: hypothetical protein PKM88_14940, partial [bacterium]|nr:hypothetical protein [bacterium]